MRQGPLHKIKRHDAIFSSTKRNIENINLFFVFSICVVNFLNCFLSKCFQYIFVFINHPINIYWN